MFAIGNGRSACCKPNEWKHEQHEDPVGDGEDYGINYYRPEEAADQIESVEVQEEEWCLTADEENISHCVTCRRGLGYACDGITCDGSHTGEFA